MTRFLLAAGMGLALFVSAPAEEKMLYPRSPAPADSAAGPRSDGYGSSLLVFGVLAAGVGGWLLWRQRRLTGSLTNRDARKLAVAESRSLGNRQYLVVADYDGKKFLLGVCPGRIDLLSPLDGAGIPPASS
ncbi:MAG TPA: flagellar biosynthetic protein FliO [Candidatus Didemnitutus sp.]|nr:flagellar biosynthetic protein FliO [Candidatus Didemnitutus sp.]